MTALGGDALAATWANLIQSLSPPTAIIAVSAHWNTSQPAVGGRAEPETIHDFGGFPDELYRIQYPAPGHPKLAQQVQALLEKQRLPALIDESQGLDHGAWVPLRVMYPQANVPVLQVSVQPRLDARHHLLLGQALAPLCAENILIVASGHMTHNLREYMLSRSGSPSPAALAFRNWTHECLMTANTEALLDWAKHPHALGAHPTPEHFLPLFVALGAAGTAYRSTALGGGWIENALAADNYRFDSLG